MFMLRDSCPPAPESAPRRCWRRAFGSRRRCRSRWV